MIRTTRVDTDALHRIVNKGVRPHAPMLAAIGFSGDVAVVLFEPGEGSREVARGLGWDGKAEVFRLGADGRKALVSGGDAVDEELAAWLRKKFEPAAPVARILVLTGDGALPLNFDQPNGFHVEPPPAPPEAKA